MVLLDGEAWSTTRPVSRPRKLAFSPHRADHFTAILIAAISAGRRELLRVHRDDQIYDIVLHAIEQEFDLEEMTVKRFV